MTWLLTGGAGYIGAHITAAFRDAGVPIVVLDDLSTGYREYVPGDVPFVEASVTDRDALGRAFTEHDVTGVVHLAALKYAGVSVTDPLLFYRTNVTGMQVLLEAVVEHRIGRVLLSSSSSWYGTPDSELVPEDTPPAAESPYGESKVISEWLLRDVARVNPWLRQTALRYFNVCGSGPPELADHSPHNLFPKVLGAMSRGERPVVNGGDYPTPDGTCIRDYIHVVDLADAHLRAALHLDSDAPVAPAYNVGRGVGSSVLEVIGAMRRVTGIDVEPEMRDRRPGDPARIVGAVDRIAADLGWTARYGLDEMVESAWRAWQRQLELYGGAPPGGGRLLVAGTI
jgi:UDP-glucose 4-epimerase